MTGMPASATRTSGTLSRMPGGTTRSDFLLHFEVCAIFRRWNPVSPKGNFNKKQGRDRPMRGAECLLRQALGLVAKTEHPSEKKRIYEKIL